MNEQTPNVTPRDRAIMRRQVSALRELDLDERGDLNPELQDALVRLVNPNRIRHGLSPFALRSERTGGPADKIG